MILSHFLKILSFYSDLAGKLLTRLPKPPNRYAINFVSDYYRKLSLYENFKLTSNCLLKLLKNVEITKASGIDQVSGKFSKDFWQNLLVSYVIFP